MQVLKDLKKKLADYEKAVSDMDKKISLKDIAHEQTPLNIEMFSKKGYHWLNTLQGKAPLLLESNADELKKRKKSKDSKEDETSAQGVSVNSVAFFQTQQR